jgi:uncharacterized repeat protein (TIGR01451 family)
MDGINLGDIEGCWEFSGAIVFQVEVSCIEYIGELEIEKLAKNLTEGDASFYHEIEASPRQEIAFLIKVRNIGDDDVDNVIIEDDLPDRLIYQDGSTRVDDGYYQEDIIDGLNLGTLAPGEESTIYFEATLEREVEFPRGVATLINTAIASGDGVDPVEDCAEIIVSYYGCHDQIESPPCR